MNMFDDIPLPGRKKFHIALFIFPIINLFIQSNISENVSAHQTRRVTVRQTSSSLLASVHYRYPELPEKKEQPQQTKKVIKEKLPGSGGKIQQRVKVSMSAYCSHPSQTWGDPYITASGARVAPHIISTNFLPFGTKVTFPEIKSLSRKTFIVGDRMSKRYWYAVDLWMPTCEQAVQFGRKTSTLAVLETQ